MKNYKQIKDFLCSPSEFGPKKICEIVKGCTRNGQDTDLAEYFQFLNFFKKYLHSRCYPLHIRQVREPGIAYPKYLSYEQNGKI